ncbi:MAG: ZIP family metal transporter [Acidobacteriota bacterium]
MYIDALLYSTAAGLCTFVGAAIVFLKSRLTRRELAFFLGLASGVMIAVVVFDLLPSAIGKGDLGGFAIGTAGGCLIIMLSNVIVADKQVNSGRSMARLGYLIMLGIALHDLPEGMAIALGNEVGHKTAAVIALGIGIHNMPEGMAIAAPLLMSGIRKRKIALQTLALGAITPLGTVIGNVAVSALPGYFGLFMGVAGGVMLYLVISQLWPEAQRSASLWRFPGLAAGIVLIFCATFVF